MHPVFADFLPAFSSRRSFVLQVPQGAYSGHDHVLFDRDFEIIDWEAPWWAQPLGCPGSMFRARLAKPRKLPGRTLVLAAPGAVNGNIWHYLFDSIPKIKIAQDAGFPLASFDWIVVNSLVGKIESNVLERLGIPRSKVIESTVAPLIRADELTFVTLGCLLPPDPWVLDWLRAAFRPPSPQPVQKRRKLFISRAQASRRRFLNESPFRNTLESNGFETIQLEKLTFDEQIAVMQEAETVVAPHGAGLTNLVWCNSQTKVVELFANEYVNGCYWAIAEMLGLQYFYDIGQPTLPEKYPARPILDLQRTAAPLSFADPEALAKRILRAIA
jgi:capsular polysaccharide biosynthesis protein